MSDPLKKIPNIEEPLKNERQITSQEEQILIKASFYAKKAQMELAFEAVFAELYATILQDKETIKQLGKELVELRNVAKKQPNVTESTTLTK